jgi:hypothetical protein
MKTGFTRRDSFRLAAAGLAVPAARGDSPRHLVVYREKGQFGGWPTNCGIWSWGDEIVVGFHQRVFERKKQGHAIKVDEVPQELQARTLDGGEHWSVEKPPSLALPVGVQYEHFKVTSGPKVTECPGGVDFLHPDFAFTGRMAMNPPGESRFYYSTNRCRSWEGPFRVPNFGHKGTAARTDYLVNGKHDLFFLLTVAKADGEQGRVIMARTVDGAKTWTRVSYVGPEPPGNDYAIMPSTVRLGGGKLLTAIRRRGLIETWRSEDGGRTWQHAGTPVPKTGKGNPASLIRLKDGRLAMTYGYRAKPFGIRALLSPDGGKTWGKDIVLREDGGSEDIGYTVSAQRTDGKVVTVYYYNTDIDEERFIGATIWNPDKV